ncbi:MAG TPA: hypothetical protein VEL07_12990 [Planctomycetota bacterium]|nr:hypothetical protein [Planctomycetota bacterium]
MIPAADTTPEQRRANVLMGLALGGLAIAVVVTMIAVFATQGLPRDPKVWKELEQRRSAAEAGAAADESVAPAAAEEHR